MPSQFFQVILMTYVHCEM